MSPLRAILAGPFGALLVLAGGCAVTRTVHPGMTSEQVAAINRELRGGDARLTYVGGATAHWTRPEITTDSLRGSDPSTGREEAAAIAALRRISVRSATAGGRAGAKWGALAGTAGGLAWGLSAWNEDHLAGWGDEGGGSGPPSTGRRFLRTIGIAALMGGAGGLAGIPVGVLLGGDVRFVVRLEP